jgi:hypothetical protein
MNIETITFKKVVEIINELWARSLAVVIFFLLGLYLGGITAEARITSDCKFSSTFRVDIQSFNCQRRI